MLRSPEALDRLRSFGLLVFWSRVSGCQSPVPQIQNQKSTGGLGHPWDGFGTPYGTAQIVNVCRPWDGGTPYLPPSHEKRNSAPRALYHLLNRGDQRENIFKEGEHGYPVPLASTLARTLSGTLSPAPSPLWLSFLGTLGTLARLNYPRRVKGV